MRLNIFARACGLAACVVFASAAAAGQQPGRARRGGLDNLALAPAPERDAAGSSAWQTFAPEGVGFSVELPGVPADETGTGRDAGRLNPSVRDYRLKADGVEYQIARTGQLPKAVYESEGFVVEGVMRECVGAEGGWESLVLMSLLEQEYRGAS